MKSYGSSAPEALKSIYDRKAETYDAERLRTAFQLRFDSSERSILRRHLREQGTVLEVGAGTGRLTNELLCRAGKVVAVDISAGMIERLSMKYELETRLETHVLDAFTLESVPGYGGFDALVSMRMVPHIQDIAGMLDMFFHAVRPGGLVIIDFWNKWSYTYLRKRSAGVYNHFVSYPEALSAIRKSGLQLTAMEGAAFGFPLNINLEFLGRTPLKRFAYSLVCICERPAEMQSGQDL